MGQWRATTISAPPGQHGRQQLSKPFAQLHDIHTDIRRLVVVGSLNFLVHAAVVFRSQVGMQAPKAGERLSTRRLPVRGGNAESSMRLTLSSDK
jgi:hypothetical protein